MRIRRFGVISLMVAGTVSSQNCLAQLPLPPIPYLPGSSDAASAAAAAAFIVVYIIQVHQASERQREIANSRARHAYGSMSPKRKAALKSKKVRYIAVDTEKNEKTSPDAKKSVMVWDTEKQEVASGNVYDVKKSPAVGETAKFDKYSAEYVGSGS